MGGGCHAACFLRAYAGAPVTRTLRPSLLRCGERPCDTLRALPENTAHQPKHSATMQHAKPRQPPPPQFARHGAHTLNHRESTATPAGPQRTPNTDTRRGAYILCLAPGIQARKDGIARSDIRVSEAKRGRVPCRNEGEYRLPSIETRSKEDICTSSPKTTFQGERKNPADSEEISGIFFEVRPLGLEPRTH